MNHSFEVTVALKTFRTHGAYWIVTLARPGMPEQVEEYLQHTWTKEQAVMDVLAKARLVEAV